MHQLNDNIMNCRVNIWHNRTLPPSGVKSGQLDETGPRVKQERPDELDPKEKLDQRATPVSGVKSEPPDPGEMRAKLVLQEKEDIGETQDLLGMLGRLELRDVQVCNYRIIYWNH